MANTNTDWVSMTDANIIRSIGDFVKHNRLQQNKTQVQLAKEAGLNPYTISQLENGVSVTLSTLIQLLRTLDELQVLEQFTKKEEISPIHYAKLKMKKRSWARVKLS
jgi:transcriptional regulator with XRE-family HTH domain